MSALESELPPMEENQAVEGEKGSFSELPFAAPPASTPSSTPPSPTSTKPNFTSETVIESKAVSMASNDCSAAASSPAEASPAKSAVTSTSTLEGTVEKSPDTSHIASASDSLTSIVNMPESSPWSSAVPVTTFGSPDVEKDFPAVLTFKGVSVILENNSVWKQFYSCGTEMILTKQGRRMFPYCRYRLAGLDPDQQYNLVLSIVPLGQYRYRWNASRWEVTGRAEHQSQGLIRAFSHHYSPCRGSDWMNSLVSFYKLKLTNNSQDQDGHIILHSMHRYIPRLHVIPVPDGVMPTNDNPVVMGHESMTFTFPQTEFMAVTTYQNFRITQLKINHNPFAKGFRQDGNNPRLNRLAREDQPMVKVEYQSLLIQHAEPSENKEEEVVDLSANSQSASASPSNAQETRLVLKPIMSNPTSKDDPYVPCIRGKHALGELVLVEPKEENNGTSAAPEVQEGFEVWLSPKAKPVTPNSSSSTPGSSLRFRKRRKRINRRWANSRGRECKTAAAYSTAVHSPSLTVAMQPEMDDIEGLLFVSFASKQALEVHVRNKLVNTSPSASPSSLTAPTPSKQANQLDVSTETDEEKIARFEAALLNDLRVLKHRQVIHPVLQEVGLKLSSLDLTMSIDLQYLGICLPLPPPEHSEATTVSPADEALPFISRTGKTSDMTKIKGWKNKFIKGKETSPSNCEGLQKNLSAFCSNMLDEYLESEAQQISERAAAFSSNPEGFVSYQLPAKGSSYVKTLDSVLKHQKPAPRFPPGANRPCPLSHKPLLYSALTSPAPPLATPAKSTHQSASSPKHPGDASGSSYAQNQGVSPRMSTDHLGVSQRPEMSFGQNQGMMYKPSGLTKFQHKLLEMEMEALNQGLSRTQLTSERLSAALSVILTKEMQPSQVLKAAPFPKNIVAGPECGQEFCRFGCVCSSLQHLNRGHFHCRRPECMFGCACFKRKITKQMSAGDSEQNPVYSLTNMEHVGQPHQGSHANKMWIPKCTDEDPEAVFIPKSAPLCVVPPKSQKRITVPRPAQPIREEDKDPVYKYLESMMTCARVREFNSKPPPEVVLEPKVFGVVTALTNPAKRQKTLNKAAGNASQETASNEAGARKQIQIQSVCCWQMDQKMILEALCQRMNHDQLSQRFYIGPYCIRPVTKIVMRKHGSSIVTYQVQISKKSNASDYEEDECDDGDDEEMYTSKSLDENTDAEEEDGLIEEPHMWIGVTPFLNGVIPAGMLRAERKPAGCQASGLIQVNGKSYNQARLQLGRMGSLHPANRLAAYLTGRLHASVDITHESSQKPDFTHKISLSRTGTINAASLPVHPGVTAQKTTGLKTPAQAPVHLFQRYLRKKGSNSFRQHSQKSSKISPVQSLASSQRNSSSSPVSLTVSQSLKVPSFLGQSGTYSFRICPPSKQGTEQQKLPGVTLPGGFTLIQLPVPGAGAAVQQSGHLNATNKATAGDIPLKKEGALNFSQLTTASLDVHTLNEVKSTSSSKLAEPSSSTELVCDEKMPSDERDEANSKQAAKQEDITSEDTSSYSSDCEGEGDEDDETVDVETVEEVKQQMVIAKMKKAVFKALLESRDSSEDLGSLMAFDSQDPDVRDGSKDKRKRENHTVLERIRRSEQRNLFDRLQTVLRSDPRAPRLHLLSEALKEIQMLVKTSKHLEETKSMLMLVQSGYIKKLSQLSGKPQNLIRQKLKLICDRQKRKEKTMKLRPFFSELLQSRAALLHANAPQPKPTCSPLLKPDFVAPAHANVPKTAAQNNLQKIKSLPPKAPTESCVKAPVPTPDPLPVSSPAQVAVTAPRSQVTIEPSEHVPSDQESQSPSKLEAKQKVSEQPDKVPGSQIPNSQTNQQSPCPSVKAAPQVPADQEGASPVSPTATYTSTKVQSAQPVALPLIRSKTGRIILPSCLKPIGQGFYTLMVMKPSQKGEEGDASSSANVQPSDVDLPKKSDTNLSASDPALDSETRRNLDSKAASSDSDPDPKGSSLSYPLAELAILNKSIFVSENSSEGSKSAGLNTSLPAARLSFNPVHRIPPVGPESDPSHPVVCRGRGRPRKNPASPSVGENEKRTVVEITRKCVSEGGISILLEKKQSKKNTLEETQMNAEDPTGKAGKEPVPGKRPRGRPPKRRSTPVKRSASSPLRSSPARLKCRSRSPAAQVKESPHTADMLGDIRRSRPLTRGALGKDFPSAKKRSWIDVEKELEPDVEFE